MSKKLHTYVAVLQRVKGLRNKAQTSCLRALGRDNLYNGFIRQYTPREEEGVMYPDETAKVQARVSETLLHGLVNPSSDWIDVVHACDLGNQESSADIVVVGRDGKDIKLAESVPASTLVFLEKRLEDTLTILGQIPVLDVSMSWSWDKEQELYVSEPVEAVKQVKRPTPLVLSPATPEHPAQVQIVNVDVPEGIWKRVALSGAWSASAKREAMDRATTLLDAVVKARTEANNIEVRLPDKPLGKAVFDYILKN